MSNEITIGSSYVEVDSQYGQGCALSEYKDVYSITSANGGDDGTKYMQWCFPSVKVKDENKSLPGKKSLPWQVRLGNLQKAKEILKLYLDLLDSVGGDGGEVGVDEDVPF